MRKSGGMWVLAMLALGVLLACGGGANDKSAAGGSCKVSDDCESGLICLDKICKAQADGDSEREAALDGDAETADGDRDTEAIENETEGDSESADSEADSEAETETDTEAETEDEAEAEAEAETEAEAEAETDADSESEPPLVPATLWDYLMVRCPWEAVCTGWQMNSCLSDLEGETDGENSNMNAHYLDMESSRLRAARLLRCVAGAKNCADYKVCSDALDGALATTPGSDYGRCAAADILSFCQDSTLLRCVRDSSGTAKGAYRQDCSIEGMACVETTSDGKTSARCKAPGCVTDGVHCDGNTQVTCSAAYGDSVNDCSVSGGVCARFCKDSSQASCTDDAAYTGCTDPTSGPCTPFCDGTILHECGAVGIPETEFWWPPHDCRLVSPDYTCSMTKLPTTYAEVPACQIPEAKRDCTSFEVVSCEGTTAHFCLSGKKVDFDCAAYGGVCGRDGCKAAPSTR